MNTVYEDGFGREHEEPILATFMQYNQTYHVVCEYHNRFRVLLQTGFVAKNDFGEPQELQVLCEPVD